MPFPDSTCFELKVLIAECYFGEPQKKSCWMLQQGTEKSIFRVIYELALDLWLRWFGTIPCPDATSFKLKVLMAKCYFGEPQNKTKIKVIFCIGFDVFTMMILYLSILPYKGMKKKCWMLQQGTEKNILSMCFQVGVCLFQYVLASWCMLFPDWLHLLYIMLAWPA